MPKDNYRDGAPCVIHASDGKMQFFTADTGEDRENHLAPDHFIVAEIAEDGSICSICGWKSRGLDPRIKMGPHP